MPEQFQPEQPVEVRFPLSHAQEQGDRSAWPWVNGWIVEQVGPDEWYVCIEDDRLATREDGSPSRPG